MTCPTRELLDAAAAGDAGAGRVVAEHLRSCALCRGIAGGLRPTVRTSPGPSCLDDAQIAGFVRRTLPPMEINAAEAHLAVCARCLRDAMEVSELATAVPPAVSPETAARVRAMVPEAAAPASRPGTRRSAGRLRSRETSILPFAPIALAAAAALLLFFAMSRSREADEVQRPKPDVQGPVARVITVPIPRPPVPNAPPAKTPETRPAPAPPPDRSPSPAPAPVANAPAPPPEKPEEPTAPFDPAAGPPLVATPPQEPPTPAAPTAPAETAPVGESFVVRPTAGDLFVRNARGETTPVKGPVRLARTETLATDAKGPAAFETDAGRIALKPDTSLQFVDAGAGVHLRLARGEGYFHVTPGISAFIVSAPAAEAAVTGTSFLLGVDGRSAVLTVVTGDVKFRNGKGETAVPAGHRSSATMNQAPARPKKADVAAASAWAKDVTKEAFVEIRRAANEKLKGAVIASPYPDWEIAAGGLAQAASRALDLPLVLGHHYREPAVRKVWFDVDRSTESEVLADGSRRPSAPTARAREAFVEYSNAIKGASWNLEPGTWNSAPAAGLVVSVRGHDLAQNGSPVTVCEISAAGVPPEVLAEAKRRVEALAAKAKLAPKLQFRFAGIDNAYEFGGATRDLMFHEENARGEGGYMNPKHARRAIALFFPAELGEDAPLAEAVIKELTTFLGSRR